MECWPVSEPPRSYILFSAMTMFGAALGRRVWVKKDVHTLWPMLNLLLIGPSGIGKSTSVHMGLGLMEDPHTSIPATERPQIIKGKATREKLHEDLVVEPHAIIVASELANFFSKEKYMEGMIPYVTQLLDYEPEVSVRTKSGSLQTVRTPSVTIVGGSTVEWLQDQLPNTATSGGFLARFLIVKEDHKFQRVADPESLLTPKQWAELEVQRQKVFNEFRYLVEQYKGRIPYADYSASDAYTLWYMTHLPETGILSPFAARAGEFVTRMSMLLALSRGHTAMQADDIRAAVKLYKYATAKLQEVIVPFTPVGKLIASVLSVVGSGRAMTDVQIKRAMRNSSTAQEVDKILASLIESRDLVRLDDGRYQRTTR